LRLLFVDGVEIKYIPNAKTVTALKESTKKLKTFSEVEDFLTDLNK